MPSLRTKQLLLKAARLQQQKEEKISKREIQRKIDQIKHLSSKKKFSKVTLKREIVQLEKRLSGVFALEKKLKSKEKEGKEQIDELKKQIKSLKKQLAHTKDEALRRKINKISFLIGELVAKSELSREVEIQKAMKNLMKGKKTSGGGKEFPSEPYPPEEAALTLKKIDEFQEKILALKNSGKVSPEKIDQLEQRLSELERKLDVSTVLEPKEEQAIKHKMLFGPQAETLPSSDEEKDEDIKDLPIPPPPLVKKKK